MNARSKWISPGAFLLAAAALAIGIVALVRDSGDTRTTTAAATTAAASTSGSMAGMPMGGTGMAEHMSAAPSEGVPDATVTAGGTRLAPRIENGVYIFDLVTKPVRWQILPNVKVTAWTYNGMVPGPELRVPFGAKVRVNVKNELGEATTVHWHGIAVPNAMDGVPDVTQKPIGVGETFTYEFDAIPAGRDSKGGTFMYHSHFDEDRQVGLGLSGAFIIDPPAKPKYDLERTLMLAEWNVDTATGATRPPMEMEGVLPNYFTINGKSFPATETIPAKLGQRVLLRLVNAGQFVHPMHLHGTDFQVVAKDGHPVAGPPQSMDVIQVAPGERVDIALTATELGKWVFHCHIGHHLTNDGEGPGGLLTVVDVTDATAPSPTTTAAVAATPPAGGTHTMSDGSSMGGMDMGGN